MFPLQMNQSFSQVKDSAKSYLDLLKTHEKTCFVAVMGATVAQHLVEINSAELMSNYMVSI